MKKIIYLDNASTTKPFKKAIETYRIYSYYNYYNPSSIHGGGVSNKKAINRSRKFFANLLGCDPNEIIFTSSATESINTVIKGIGQSLKNDEYILTTPIEHKATLNSLENLKHKFIKINNNGIINKKDLSRKITKNSKLLSFIIVNNETGIIQKVKKIVEIAKNKNPEILIHIDGVQGFLKSFEKINDFNVDFLSLSGHKIHSVKGIGLLYKNNNIKIPQLISGGKQEYSLRAGTENIGAIKALETSCRLFKKNKNKYLKKIEKISIYLKKKIKKLNNFNLNSKLSPIFQNNIISIYHKNIPGEVILNALSEKKIFISTGSACNEKNSNKSHVLKALKYKSKRIKNTFRVSLSIFNDFSDIDTLIKHLKIIDNNFNNIYKIAGRK